MNIYDVLDRLVTRATWTTEQELRDALQAVKEAREAELFGARAHMIERTET